jgi:hypothetical protein
MTAFTIQDVSRRSGLSEPTLRTHLGYLREKAAVWDARDRGDELAEAQAWERVRAAVQRMEVAR